MARWRNRKRPISQGGDITVTAAPSLDAPEIEAPAQNRNSPRDEELGLMAALAELSQLQQMAAAVGVAPGPPPVAAPETVVVPELDDTRIIRISSTIEALVEPCGEEAEPEKDPSAVNREVSSAFTAPHLPAESRLGIEILNTTGNRRCPASFAEGFRKLRERLIEEQNRWALSGRQLNSVAVISPRRGSGRSVIARNLAACLGASPDARVLLIDADPGKPSLHRRLRTLQTPGLAEAARSGPMWRESVRRVPETGLFVLTLGAVGSGAEGLDDTLIASLLEQARGDFSWIFLDGPSMETAQAEMLARLADASLLVLRNETEYFDEAEAAVRRLDSSRLLGFVLNFAAGN